MDQTQMVGMAEMAITCSAGGVLMALGLGSCVGVCVYDYHKKIAGLAHVVLPASGGQCGSDGKYADTAIPALLKAMAAAGANERSLRYAIVGGAQLFIGASTGARLDIGPRNVEAVLALLKARNAAILAQDTGGNSGRTVTVFGDGRVRLRTLGKTERDLVNLSGAGSERGSAGLAGTALNVHMAAA